MSAASDMAKLRNQVSAVLEDNRRLREENAALKEKMANMLDAASDLRDSIATSRLGTGTREGLNASGK